MYILCAIILLEDSLLMQHLVNVTCPQQQYLRMSPYSLICYCCTLEKPPNEPLQNLISTAPYGVHIWCFSANLILPQWDLSLTEPDPMLCFTYPPTDRPEHHSSRPCGHSGGRLHTWWTVLRKEGGDEPGHTVRKQHLSNPEMILQKEHMPDTVWDAISGFCRKIRSEMCI